MKNKKILKLIGGLGIGISVGVSLGVAMDNILVGFLLGIGKKSSNIKNNYDRKKSITGNYQYLFQ